MKIGIIGAGGDVGRELFERYLQQQMTQCSELTLFYHSEQSRRYLLGMLYDSMMQGQEQHIKITDQREDLKGLELVVLCAGLSIPSDIHKVYPPRKENQDNGRVSFFENRSIVLEWAGQIYRHCPEALIVLVTNPVSPLLAEIVSAYPSLQVAGCGITNDTLRVRNETARQFPEIDPELLFMVGEHDLLNQTVAFPFSEGGDERMPDRELFESTFESETLKKKYLTDLKDLQNRQLSSGEVVPGLYEELPLIYRSFLKHRFAHFLCKTHRSTALAVLEIIAAYDQGNRWVSVETAVREDPAFSSCVLGIPVLFDHRKIVSMKSKWSPAEEAVLRSMEAKYRLT